MIKKAFWFVLGCIFLVIAYIGIVTPGIPWSTPAFVAAICFSKSSTRMHNYIHSHPLFGPFLTGWTEKKIFPTKAKYFMLVTMFTSLAVAWFTLSSIDVFLCLLSLMVVIVVWGWRYPGSEEEYNRRKEAGEKIAWLK